jgi:hypothetical protein
LESSPRSCLSLRLPLIGLRATRALRRGLCDTERRLRPDAGLSECGRRAFSSSGPQRPSGGRRPSCSAGAPPDPRLHDCRVARSHRALVHTRMEGEVTPGPIRYAITRRQRTEFGRPAASIRFRTATPMAASACWAGRPRARSRGPISALYRPIVVSTNERRP